MLATLESFEHLLRSPVSGGDLRRTEGGFEDRDGMVTFPAVAGRPVLIDFDRSVFSRDDMLAADAESSVARPSEGGWRARLKAIVRPPKKITIANVAHLVAELEKAESPLVLVVGGGTVGQGMAALYDHPDIRVLALDVYASPCAQIIADAHSIPLAGGSVDAVVVQAVLEHVLEPAQVVAEIHRVLKPDGLVYAETPFIQHVHEGAYDFTRFTESGHRYLFRRFSMIGSGVCGGAGTQLLWSIDYFVRGLFRSVKAGKAAKLMLFWLLYMDGLVADSYAVDAASGYFFLGRRSEGGLSPRDIIDFYGGAQRAQ